VVGRSKKRKKKRGKDVRRGIYRGRLDVENLEHISNGIADKDKKI